MVCIDGQCGCDPNYSIDFCGLYCIEKSDSVLIHVKDDCANTIVLNDLRFDTSGIVQYFFQGCGTFSTFSYSVYTRTTTGDYFNIDELDHKVINDSIFSAWGKCRYYQDTLFCDMIWRYELDKNIHRDTCQIIFVESFKL